MNIKIIKTGAAVLAMAGMLCLSACDNTAASTNVTRTDGVTPIIDNTQNTAAPAGQAATAEPAAANAVSMQQALDIALQDAALSAEQVTVVKQKQDKDDGVLEYDYDIEFIHENTLYDYDINAEIGEVKKVSREPVAENTADETGLVGMDAAKQAALTHAGAAEGDVVFTKMKLEYDDGIAEYNIEFTYNGSEYEYELDGKTGDIIEYDREAIKGGIS